MPILQDYLKEIKANIFSEKEHIPRQKNYHIYLNGHYYQSFIDMANAQKHIKTNKFWHLAKGRLVEIRHIKQQH